MLRKKLFPIVLTLFLLTLVISQNNICYSNCKEGYCSDTNPKLCTACDKGQVNINGKCISGSTQPVHFIFISVSISISYCNRHQLIIGYIILVSSI